MAPAAILNGAAHSTPNPPKAVETFSHQTHIPKTLAISPEDDDPVLRAKYRPFLLREDIASNDWISNLELSTVLQLSHSDLQRTSTPETPEGSRLRILLLYGSLRPRSYSKLLAYECARILHRLGADVRIYNPKGLPVKDDEQTSHEKVQELRNLSRWSDGHVWVSPEQHGNLTAVFKNQIDWIPLTAGSVRPTQGRTLAVLQVSGGSQSFNAVNSLRILGRWMRMFTIPNQSSVPKAYTQFSDACDEAVDSEEVFVREEGGSRLLPSGNRDRVVDCMEELVKYTLVMRQHFELFGDRYSERAEKAAKAAKA